MKETDQDLLALVVGFEKQYGLGENSVKFGKLLYLGLPYCILLPLDYDIKSPKMAAIYKCAIDYFKELKIECPPEIE